MGNSPSTIQIYNDEIDPNMQQKILDSGGQQLESTLSQENVAKNIAAVTDGGTDFKAIRTKADDSIYGTMQLTATSMFPACFGYPFGAIPSNAISAPALIESFCSISTPVNDQIILYLGSEFFR
ncbi:hypothetical protein P691DRAFT_769185 [Macrolepiota fuliginosa MF-IS2]|uniref:Uncharacterized protein n=1 Tax=Macrolepiota fuliginosa MF-IS2 TaxID=1400762 RepID=A0A9P5WXS9_9AGAR|nr:hypothetical protein P691DRAFT_769185 [Macrolepiota fuliginosa MF-IS2]